MEMTIDEAQRILSNGLVNAPSEHEWCMAFKMAIETMSKYQQLQADYETRLKADMVAMLTEIQLEIEELEVPLLYLAEDYEGGVLDCKKIIQQKINALKGEQAAG